MHILRHPHEVSAYVEASSESEITGLIQQRLTEILSGDDLTMEDVVFFVVLEPGEGVADIEAAIGTQLLTLDGQPLWEFVEQHNRCFEIVMVLESSGYGAIVFVLEGPATNADLLALCRQHATPDTHGIHP